MEKVATCPNGHNFDVNTYDKCPYCPNSEEKTVFNAQFIQEQVGSLDNGKTQVVSAAPSPAEKPIPVQKAAQHDSPPLVHQGTRIITPEQSNQDKQAPNQNSDRKIVALLVSYDIVPQGKVFMVYEGKNLIGSDPYCDIIIPNDAGISGKHLTILYRGGIFRYRDEFSTNGTFVNGNMNEEGYLENNNQIKIGATRFIFLAIPPNLS